MTKPKIAVLMDWYLPGTKAGGPVRSVYSLVNLLKPYFDFYIITTDTDLGTTRAYEDINANVLFQKEGINYYYFSKSKLNSETFMEVIRHIDPALIYLNSFWSFHFSISFVRLKSKGLIKAPLLLAPRGMLGKGALGLKAFKKNFFLITSKLLGWYKFVTFHASQQQEEMDIKKEFPGARVLVAPNINSSPAIANESVKEPMSLRMFFLSRVAAVKNLHFALEVLKDVPDNYTIHYDIFGNLEDKEYWESCQTIISQLPKNVKVAYREQLQFDRVQDTIKHYNCLFMPTLNENYGHSIVESLLCGCPAIISDQTPWSDLQKNNAGFALPLDNKQGFLDAILECAKLSPTDFAKKSGDSLSYIRSKIDPEAIIQLYKNLFNDRIKMTALKTDLSTFNNDWYKPGRNLFIRASWYLINLCFFRSPFPFYGPKRVVLRLFGAKVGKGLIIKPHVSIKYPWKLVVGDHVWIGEEVWIDNLAKVTLKDHSCVSQGALLLCGNHNYKKTSFDLIVGEITLDEGSWAGAKTVICPGVRLGANSLLTVGSIATSSLEANWIYQGNPAKKLKVREIKY